MEGLDGFSLLLVDSRGIANCGRSFTFPAQLVHQQRTSPSPEPCRSGEPLHGSASLPGLWAGLAEGSARDEEGWCELEAELCAAAVPEATPAVLSQPLRGNGPPSKFGRN